MRQSFDIAVVLDGPEPMRCLSSLRPALAQSQYAGAGRMTFAVPRPWPAFGFDSVAGQPRTERRDKHRAHPIGTPWNGIGLGMDQQWIAQLIPSQQNLFIVGVQTFCPEIARVTDLLNCACVTAIVTSRSSALMTPSTVDCSQRAIAILSEYIRQRASVSSLFR
jgi:hypothetical protein